MNQYRLDAQKKYVLCWWCNGALVGPGGVAGKEPLSFRSIDNPHGEGQFKVHISCEKNARNFLLYGIIDDF